jgi:hypothetical protein
MVGRLMLDVLMIDSLMMGSLMLVGLMMDERKAPTPLSEGFVIND